jgi:hypothetical protein
VRNRLLFLASGAAAGIARLGGIRPWVPTQPKLTVTSSPPGVPGTVGIDLYWLPLGAGGRFVRLNGLVYEAVKARRERRRPLDLYHSALEVRIPEGRFVIENAWPIPDAAGTSRGVAVESPRRLSDDPDLGRRLLDLTASVPALVWGRDERGTGEMWNSNSVIAWLLARSGFPTEEIRPPANGRPPGWDGGLLIAAGRDD